MNPTFYMLIGVVAAGKSTWTSSAGFDWTKTAVISTDNVIERVAKEHGKTYSDVFKDTIDYAVVEMNKNLKNAIEQGMDIVLDQTNLTVKSRHSKLVKIPNNYYKVAVFFPTPTPDELTRRLASRPGKFIPDHVVTNMLSSIQPPSKSEGFDKIVNL